jgi:competence ComEA-like helix-hairpin-helix protein
MNTRNLGISLLLLCLALPAAASGGKTSQAKNGRSTKAAPAATAASGSVNVNSATAEQIALLPRVGIKAAQRIVEYRKANGNFKRIEDVMEVKGVGEKLFVSLRPHLSISGPTTLTAKIKSTGIRKSRVKPGKSA